MTTPRWGGWRRRGVFWSWSRSWPLAEMHLAEGDTAAAAELADELLPIFRAKDIHREAAAAGLILVKALRREMATVGAVQRLAARFERWRNVAARQSAYALESVLP